jgi:NAD+ kinase
MTTPFARVGLIGKSDDPDVSATLRALTALLDGRGLEIRVDEDAAHLLTGSDLPVVSRAELARQCDLAIVVGGDGTLLHAARSLTDAGCPVLGVNRGRLGFLVDVSPDEMDAQVNRILGGEFAEEQRMLLHAAVTRDDVQVAESTALNDVVVHKKDIARMIELETWIDGHFLNRNRSDGLIIATPTGSTAYALSGGGPILHPNLHAITLVPICPHTLSNRPIVVHHDSRIEILVHEGTLQSQISCDGQVNLPLDPGDRITVRRHEKVLRLIHPPGHDYFDILRRKLRWSEQP